MSCMTKFTLRSLMRNRARTVVSVCGIALSCALITAIFTTVTSINAGLFQRTVESEGSWGIYASDIASDALSNLKGSDGAPDVATYAEIGSAAFSETERSHFGGYLTVKTAPTTEKGSCEPYGAPLTLVPQIEEGRMPTDPDEIALPTILEGETFENPSSGVFGAKIALGSEIALDLGERWIDDGKSAKRLDSTSSFISDEESEKLGISAERLESTRKHTYTVVGFYNELGTFIGNDFTATGSGLIGITAPVESGEAFETATSNEDGPSTIVGAYASLQGFSSVSEIESFAADMGVDSYALHGNLLRYLGVTDGRAVYDSLYVIGATLALVVAAAGVSLIYNSFSISVAERTRQFGMLSSIGASKRQLRRSVLFEALVLGIVGIPIGVGLGLSGVALVLSFTSEALGAAISLDGSIPFSIDPAMLAGCGAFSFAILLASAWIPALRASRVSAIDAIRQSRDVRLARRALRRRRKIESHAANGSGERGANAGANWANGLFGAPAALAMRNKERASSRSRTVTASLAMSVLLLIACGSVKLYLDPFAGRVDSKTGGSADVTATFNYTEDAPSHTSPEAQADFIEAIEGFVVDAKQVEGATLISVVKQGQSSSIVPASMLDADARKMHASFYSENSADWVPSAFTEEGDYIRDITTFYLDGASFAKLAESVGLDASDFEDPNHPKAIALNAYQGSASDGRYFETGGIAKPGTITLCDIPDDDANDEWEPWNLVQAEDGSIQAMFLNTETAQTEMRALPEDAPSTEIEVVAIVDEVPEYMASISPANHFPVVIMPESVCDASPDTGLNHMLGFSFANVSFEASDHASATDQMEEVIAKISDEGIVASVYDRAKEAESARMLLSAIQLFVLLFSIITALVATANVFNTLTNSIVLRTREFAVLESIGMGKQDFRAMLAFECIGFAAKGFAIGLVAGLAATIAMYYGASLSFAGTPFSLPWAYIAGALGLTLAVLAASVAFALRKTRTASVVEILRSDAG